MLDAIKQQIQTLKGLIEKIKEPLNINNNDIKGMLSIFVNLSEARLSSQYATVLSQAKITNLNSHIMNINNLLNSYINYPPVQVISTGIRQPQSNEQQYLLNILSYYDAALAIVMSIPALEQTEATQAFDITIGEFKAKADEVIESITKINEQSKQQIENTFTQIQAREDTQKKEIQKLKLK